MKSKYSDGYVNFKADRAKLLEKQGHVVICDKESEDDALTTKNPTVIPKQSKYPVQYLSRTGFDYHSAKKKWPKIAWVQDYSKNGGAELSNFHVVGVGEKLGFDIVGVSPNNSQSHIINESDLVIINNVFEFDKKEMQDLYWCLFENRKKFIKYDHDMRELKRLHKTRCLFERSEFNVFISPAHAKAYGKEHIDGVYFPLAIDVDKYKGSGCKRGNEILVPTFRKGPNNHKKYITEHKRDKFIVVDNNAMSALKNVDIVGKQTQENMIKLYSRCKAVLHQPQVLWAGERVYFEALLCGCEVIVNNNVGHVSYDYNKIGTDYIIDKLKHAPYQFWKMVENIL